MTQASCDSREILARLVAMDTVSSRSNLDLVHWVADYLGAQGVEVVLDHDAGRTKANLFASLGPRDAAGVCLHGHTDVVPVEGQTWTSDPFTLTERAGLLHGRGTCDMKAWIACALAAVPAWSRQRLRTPLHIALSYDEEVGCLGAPGLIQLFGRSVPRPALALIGEPSLLAPVSAHKGVVALSTRVTGHAVHSSLIHKGANAATAAAVMAVEIHRIARQWCHRPGPAGMQPGGPTMNVGVLRAGAARNMVADHAALDWDLRYRASDDPDELQREVHSAVDAALRQALGAAHERIRLETVDVARVPAFQARQDSRALALLRSLGVQAADSGVAYGAEAGQYAQAGIDTVIFGPGSIEQAHQADEFIAVDQLQACDAFMQRLGYWAQDHALLAPARVAEPASAAP